MGQIRKTIQAIVTASVAASATMLGVGCVDTKTLPPASASGVRGDVTDVRPMASVTPAAYQPPVYDTTGPIPTAPQPMTPDPVIATASTPMISTTPAEKSIGGGKSHTVRKGETLFSIAKATYGDGKAWKKIVSANPGVTPAKLKVGQVLTLPA
jgi:5'-nucleotidase